MNKRKRVRFTDSTENNEDSSNKKKKLMTVPENAQLVNTSIKKQQPQRMQNASKSKYDKQYKDNNLDEKQQQKNIEKQRRQMFDPFPLGKVPDNKINQCCCVCRKKRRKMWMNSNWSENKDNQSVSISTVLDINFDELKTYKEIKSILKPKETVSKAMQRLSGKTRLSTIDILKLRRAPDYKNSNIVSLLKLTELASQIITYTGNINIYQHSYESIKKIIEKLASEEPESDDEDSQSDDERNNKHFTRSSVMWNFPNKFISRLRNN